MLGAGSCCPHPLGRDFKLSNPPLVTVYAQINRVGFPVKGRVISPFLRQRYIVLHIPTHILAHRTSTRVTLHIRHLTKNNRFLNAIVFLGFVVVFTIFITTAVSLRNWFSERAAARDIPLSEIIPWGIWKSQNPPLLLYISPELQLESETLPGLEQYIFPAFYITENENIPMLVRFRTSVFNRNTPHSMTIFPLDDYEGISLTSTDFSRFDDNVLLVIIQHRIEVLFYRFIDYCYIYIKDDWPTPLSWNNSS